MVEFKPCPFCGGKVEVKINATTLHTAVLCARCNVTMKHNYKGNGRLKALLEELIAEDWNRRTKNND